MARGRVQVVRRWPDTADTQAWLSSPRHDLVIESATDSSADSLAEFAQSEGPFVEYRRTVRREGNQLVDDTRYRVIIPWFRWLFGPLIRRSVARRAPGPEPERLPAWSPPDRLTPRQVQVIGLLAAANLLTAFVNTLFTQTVAFAGDDLGVGDWGRGVGGTVVRVGILIGLPAALLADRIGRRRVVVVLAWVAPILASLGALAPNFGVLVATQTLSRPLGLALDLLVAVIATEEMPRNSRAYAVSILAMASGLGAGVAVISLPLADLGESGWRFVYLLALVWLFVAVDLTRRLPESRRFEWHMADALADKAPRMHRRRLATQMSVAFFGNLLLAPASFFQNSFLKDDRGFSAGGVALFTLVTSTPAVLGLVIGGRVADQRGRRRLAATAAPLGAVLIALSFWMSGTAMWFGAIAGGLVAALAYPPLAVYRTEMFGTANRGKAAFLILASALLGGSLSLLVTGALLDRGIEHGPIMLALVAGPLVVSALVLFTYPETAHRELEDINPEDHRLPSNR